MFHIKVEPAYKDTEFIRVTLANCSDEDQTISVIFTDEKYKAWAQDHGDVFKLKGRITLHQKMNTAEDGWIRFVVILFVRLVS